MAVLSIDFTSRNLLIDRSHSHDVTGCVAAIFSMECMFGKKSGSASFNAFATVLHSSDVFLSFFHFKHQQCNSVLTVNLLGRSSPYTERNSSKSVN